MNGLAKLTVLKDLYPHCVACACLCEPHKSCCRLSAHMHTPPHTTHCNGNASSSLVLVVVLVTTVVVLLVVSCVVGVGVEMGGRGGGVPLGLERGLVY